MSRPDNPNIVVTGFDLISPVGHNATQSCAAIRAGLARFTEHPYFACAGMDPDWDEEEPLIASLVPSIDPFLDGPERLFSLLVPPLIQFLASLNMRRKDLQKGAFFMALPQPDSVIQGWALENKFIPELFRRTGLEAFKVCMTRQTGHTGMFCLIEDAMGLLLAGDIEFCVIAGVDSYLMEDRLEFLDKSWRIKSSKNVDGYIPGEAASMIFLELEDRAKSRSRNPLATITSVGLAMETQTLKSDKNSSGRGLSEAIDKAVRGANDHSKIGWVLCDLNGESYRGYEWGLVQTQIKVFSDPTTLTHPADCIGDVGAATGGVLLSYAIQAFRRGYGPTERALLWTASDNGLRAALCMAPAGS